MLDLEEFHYENSFAWEDETRGLQEIMSAMDELFDKVWYNRHMNMMYHLGRVRISTLRNENETFSQLNSITYIGVFLRLVTYSHLP
ncbi:hypothetical protein B9L20_23335 [Serratia marcescens]|nr:hypothetical protein B9L20_23335 [Serratia marcescens]